MRRKIYPMKNAGSKNIFERDEKGSERRERQRDYKDFKRSRPWKPRSR